MDASHTHSSNSPDSLNPGTAVIRPDAVAVFQELKADPERRQLMSIADLFSLAQQLAVKGRFQEKLVVLAEWVTAHSTVTPDDLSRVRIFQADIVRRRLDPIQALSQLNTIPLPESAIARFEYFNARLQANCFAAQLAPEIARRNAFLAEARADSDRIAQVVETSRSVLPADTIAYALEIVVALRIGQAAYDSQLTQLRDLYAEAIIAIPPGPLQARAHALLDWIDGKIYFFNHKFPEAMCSFLGYFEKSGEVYYKLGAAIEFLAAVAMNESHKSDPLLCQRCDELVAYALEHFSSHAQFKIDYASTLEIAALAFAKLQALGR